MTRYRGISGALRASFFAVTGGILVAAAVGAPGAEGAIRCRGGFQAVGGNLISTPYCQDQLVAEVARSYGIKVSAREIRSNPNQKRHVCQFIGRDVRVQLACIDAFPTGRRPF